MPLRLGCSIEPQGNGPARPRTADHCAAMEGDTEDLHIGYLEGIPPPTFAVSGWIRPGEVLKVEDRRLDVLHAPGHSMEDLLHVLERLLKSTSLIRT